MNGRRVEVTEDVVTTVPNTEAIVQDFQIMGEGLVDKVELRTERWVVWIGKIHQKIICMLWNVCLFLKDITFYVYFKFFLELKWRISEHVDFYEKMLS